MNRFEFVSHPAEEKFIAHGNTFARACAHAIEALLSLYGVESARPEKNVTLLANGRTKADVVHNLLQSIIVLIDGDKQFPVVIRKLSVDARDDGIAILAELGTANTRTLEFEGEVKSITHHQLTVEKQDGDWKITVVVDV